MYRLLPTAHSGRSCDTPPGIPGQKGICELPVNAFERTAFEQRAVASGLLTEEQINEARTAVGWSDGDEADADAPLTEQQLADRLVEMGRLNVWQAKQLLEGRTKFTLGQYRIVDSIGKGGMGQVFKAEHSVMGRIVAIKVLPLSRQRLLPGHRVRARLRSPQACPP